MPDKSIKRWIPEKAYHRLCECLLSNPPQFKFERDGFFFLLDLPYRLKAFNKSIKYTRDGKIRISSKYFKKYFTENYAPYIYWLVNNDILHCDRVKKTGKAYGYCLNPSLESKVIAVLMEPGTRIYKRIIENVNKRNKHHVKLSDHVKIIKKFYKDNMTIDFDRALAFLEAELENKTISFTQFNASFISISAIAEKDLFFKISNKNGRLNSNLTNLKGSLRGFVGGEKFVHIDCRNSQPLIVNFLTDFIIRCNERSDRIRTEDITTSSSLVSPLLPPLGDRIENVIRKNLNSSELKRLEFFPDFDKQAVREFDEYKEDTFSGDFYSSAQKRYQKLYSKSLTRDEIKEMIYRIFFSKNGSYAREKEMFRKMYPVIYKMIYMLKEDEHNKFALCLQNIESEIFIQIICKRLVDEGIIPLTIHDSVVVIEKHKGRSIEIMGQVYQELIDKIPQFVCTDL